MSTFSRNYIATLHYILQRGVVKLIRYDVLIILVSVARIASWLLRGKFIRGIEFSYIGFLILAIGHSNSLIFFVHREPLKDR